MDNKTRQIIMDNAEKIVEMKKRIDMVYDAGMITKEQYDEALKNILQSFE